MPGPIHGGALYVQQWAPGAGVANTSQDTTVGDFSEDMVVVGIIRASGNGSANSDINVRIGKAGSRAKYDVVPWVYTNSPVFNPANAGGLVEFGIYLPAGESCYVEVRHRATDEIVWNFIVAPPPVTDRQIRQLSQALQEMSVKKSK